MDIIMSSHKSDIDSLWELIKDIKFGMLTHRHANGELHSHPLTTQNKSADEGSTLYFFISRKSELAQRVQQDGNVNSAHDSLPILAVRSVRYRSRLYKRRLSTSGYIAVTNTRSKLKAIRSGAGKLCEELTASVADGRSLSIGPCA